MPKFDHSKLMEEKGVLFTKEIAIEARSIFREVNSNDTGIDAFIELVDEENATGDLIAVQIKAGSSYWNKTHTRCRIKLKKKWLNYWQNYSLPVVLVVYEDVNKRAAWLDIHRYLLANPTAINKKELSFEAREDFCAETITQEFPKLVKRVDKPGLPKIASWIISRAEKALDEAKVVCNRISKSGGLPDSPEVHKQLMDIILRFDGEVTCIDRSGICIIHRDTRLIGCNLFDYKDIYGQYVFKLVGEQNAPYLFWIDDFDADRFNPKGNFSEYTKAGTSEPTRLNFAVYHFFEPWSCYILVEAHHKITR